MKLVSNQSKHSQYYSSIDNINKYNVIILNEIPKISSISLEVFLKEGLIKSFSKNLGLSFIFYILLAQFPFIKKSKIKILEEDKKYLLRVNITNFNQIYAFLDLIFLKKFKITSLNYPNKAYIWLSAQNLILSRFIHNLLRNKTMISNNVISRINVNLLTSNTKISPNTIKNLPFLWLNKKSRISNI